MLFFTSETTWRGSTGGVVGKIIGGFRVFTGIKPTGLKADTT